MRRNRGSIAGNPTLVGAVTILVVIVAVFLAYNANNGLPFVPTRELKVQISSGSNLVKGNDVRLGGYRVGVVSEIRPVALNGLAAKAVGSETAVDQPTAGALLILKLDKKAGEIPVDSTVTIRPRSALGLKYVDLTRGASSKHIADGGTLPVAQSTVPVQFDDIYRIFDEPTRTAAQGALTGFGDAFVGRGTALNQTISLLPPLLTRLQAVTANLADPRTGLGRFFTALDRAANTLAPVAATNARLFTDMATTFAAISSNTKALQDTIAKSPSTLDVSTQSLHDQLPFLRDTAELGRNLVPAAQDLRGALPTISSALEVGTPVTRRTVGLYANLQDALVALRDLAQTPTTNAALRGLTATVGTLNPTLRYLGPYITVCNYWNYFWTFTAEHFSEADPTGGAQRALLNFANQQTNSVGSAGATAPANGQGVPPGQIPEYAHGQPYGAAVNPDGSADCEMAQRGYPTRIAKYLPSNLLVAVDPHTPGSQGPVFKSFDDRLKPPGQRALGTPRVPPGETFTRDPTGLGAQLP